MANRNTELIVFLITISLVPLVFRYYDSLWVKWASIALFFLAGILLGNQKNLKIGVLFLPLSFFVLYWIIPVSVKGETFKNLKNLLPILMSFISYLYIYFCSEFKESDFHLFYYVIALSIFLVSMYGIFQFYKILPPSYDVYGRVTLSSSFGLVNFAAEYVAIAISFPIAMLFIIPFNRLALICGLISFLSGLYFIIISQTRSAYIGLSLAIIYIFLFAVINQKNLKVLYIFLLLFLLFITPSGKKAISRLFSSFNFEEPGVKTRIETYKTAISILKTAPLFGIGAGNFENLSPKYLTTYLKKSSYHSKKRIAKVHNDYLQILVEGGIFGGIIFGIILFILLYYLFSFIRKGNSLYLPFHSSILSTATISLFSFPLFMPIPNLLFFTSAAIVERYEHKEHIYCFHIEGIGVKAAKAFCIFFCIIISIFSLRMHRYLWFINAGRTLSAHGFSDKALLLFSQATKIIPWNEEGYFYKSMILEKLDKLTYAIEEIKKAEAIKPFFPEIKIKYGEYLLKNEDFERGMEKLNETNSINPFFKLESLLLLLKYCEKFKPLTSFECKKGFLLEFNEDFDGFPTDILYKLCDSYPQTGLWEKGKECFATLLKRERYNPMFLKKMGEILLHLSRKIEANLFLVESSVFIP